MKIVAYAGMAVKQIALSVNNPLTRMRAGRHGSASVYFHEHSRPPMDPIKPRYLLAPALVVAILAVSTASILIRLAERDAPSLAIAALRLTFATAMLAPLALTRYRPQVKAMKRGELLLAALSGLFLAVHFGTWITSLEYTSVASSVVLVSTGPLWVALLSRLFLGERMSRASLLGLVLAVLGGVVIATAAACTWAQGFRCSAQNYVLHGRTLWGNFLALAGAWAVSGYLLLGRRLRRTVALLPYIFVTYGFAAVGLLVAVEVSGQAVLGFRPLTYVWLLLLAIVPQLIGHSTYNWALRFLPAAIIAATTLGEPIGSSVLAYLILGETPGLSVVFGGALILSGIYLAVRLSPKSADRPE